MKYFLILLMIIFSPLAAHAQISTSATGAATSVIEVDVDEALEMNTDASVEADTKMGGVIEGEGKASINTNAKSKGKEGSKAAASISSEGMLDLSPTGIAIKSAAQVRTEADLKVYVKNAPRVNPEVASVTFEAGDERGSEVAVAYRHRGKLFGFIPVNVNSKTTVEVDESNEIKVKVKKPWWSFLVAKENINPSLIKAKIENNTKLKAKLKANASAKIRAEVVEAIIAELNAQASAQVN